MAPDASGILEHSREESITDHHNPPKQVSVASTPAANLPTKVLKRMFSALQQQHDSDADLETHRHGFQSSWITATWVCHRWREVALALPSLWVNIDIAAGQCDPDAISTLFERAGDEPVSVSLDGTDMDMPAACALVQPHGQRVAHLCVLFDDTQAVAVQVLILHMGPKLNTLQIFCGYPAVAHELSLDPTAVPNLHTLILKNIFLHPTSPLHGLMDLTLDSLWAVLGQQDTREYIHELLSACPDLEELELSNSLPMADHLLSAPSRVLTFPRLRALWVDDLAIDLPSNLAGFEIPASASFGITARYDGCPPDPDDPHTVLPLAVLPSSKFACFPALADTRSLALRLRLRAPCCSLPDVELAGTNWSLAVPSLLHVAENCSRLPALLPHLLHELPRTVVPAHIVCLALHLAPGLPDHDAWPSLLGQFRNVHALALGGRRAFAGAVAAMSADRRGVKLLPRLAELTACIAAPRNSVTTPAAKAFGDWLAVRADRGMGLGSLVVQVPARVSLNEPTVHLASALVAYMFVRGASARVVRETCITCHGRHEHVDLPDGDSESLP